MTSKAVRGEEAVCGEEEYVLKYQLLSKYAIAPKQQYESDAGYD